MNRAETDTDRRMGARGEEVNHACPARCEGNTTSSRSRGAATAVARTVWHDRTPLSTFSREGRCQDRLASEMIWVLG